MSQFDGQESVGVSESFTVESTVDRVDDAAERSTHRRGSNITGVHIGVTCPQNLA